MRKKYGFTLIETIVAVTILAIVMYAVIAIFVNSGVRGANVEVFSVAQALAEGKLEEKMAKPFSSLSSESASFFSGDLNAYSYQLTVNYVSREALDAVVGSPTDYKKVRVSVSHHLLSRPISLESIRANY